MGRINTGGVKKKIGDNTATGSSVSGTTLKLNPPKGYYDGVTGTVNITDADFMASKIIDGVNLFGINGDALVCNTASNLVSGFSVNTNLIAGQTTVSVGSGVYGLPSVLIGNFTPTLSGLVNGFHYVCNTDLNNDATNLSYVPYYSGSYGREGGLYMYSNTTGQEVLICQGSLSEQTRYRSILAFMSTPTTVTTIAQFGESSSTNSLRFDWRNTTVSKNFFKTGIMFRDKIVLGYGPYNITYQAQTKLNGYIVKF